MLFNDYQTLSMLEVKTKISKLTNLGKPELDFLYYNIHDWLQSDKREYMLTAQSYYNNDNDIVDRKRYYIDRKGVKQEAENLSNSKLAHPFMRRLVNQKVNYLLAKEFTVHAQESDLGTKLSEKYFNKRFRSFIKNVGREAIVNGIAWVQVYYDDRGELCFKRIPSEEIIPFWEDSEHTVLSAVIRVYTITQYNSNGNKKEVKKVEYHTLNGVWYYILGDRGLKPDPDMGENLKGHFTVSQEQVDSEGNKSMVDVEATWDRMPFVAFKYNNDEISLLKWIKPLVDDYDINTSDNSNNLQDVPNSIKVVKGYDGTDKGEFVQNLATYRTAFVAGDGDMSALVTPLDSISVENHLNRLKKDIYEAGSGVDSQDQNLGNVTGVALKFRYAALQMDTNDMANEFSVALDELIWFIKVDMKNKGLGDYMDTTYDIIFNTDIIINESEVINDARNSVGIISDETIIANHPWVIDVAEEQKRINKELDEQLQNQQLQLEQDNDNFGNPVTTKQEPKKGVDK